MKRSLKATTVRVGGILEFTLQSLRASVTPSSGRYGSEGCLRLRWTLFSARGFPSSAPNLNFVFGWICFKTDRFKLFSPVVLTFKNRV